MGLNNGRGVPVSLGGENVSALTGFVAVTATKRTHVGLRIDVEPTLGVTVAVVPTKNWRSSWTSSGVHLAES